MIDSIAHTVIPGADLIVGTVIFSLINQQDRWLFLKLSNIIFLAVYRVHGISVIVYRNTNTVYTMSKTLVDD